MNFALSGVTFVSKKLHSPSLSYAGVAKYTMLSVPHTLTADPLLVDVVSLFSVQNLALHLCLFVGHHTAVYTQSRASLKFLVSVSGGCVFYVGFVLIHSLPHLCTYMYLQTI